MFSSFFPSSDVLEFGDAEYGPRRYFYVLYVRSVARSLSDLALALCPLPS